MSVNQSVTKVTQQTKLNTTIMKNLFKLTVLLFTSFVFSQAGHIMQGVGAFNMSMGGASTAQPLDVSGALQWNPASIATFDSKILNVDAGLFFSSPELTSTFGPFTGTTKDFRGTSILPSLAMVWGKEDSKHTFGVSAFGISGFGVTFPENNNYPQDLQGNPNPSFNPNDVVNPINFPQFAGGFGHIESDYMLLQVGFTWAYEISEKFSIGIEPTFNFAALELAPNPLASPGMLGYPASDKATALGVGAQVGVFYDSGSGLKLGASYKTTQHFGDFKFNNTYLLDGSAAPDVDFNMDYPAIFSLGVGYSTDMFDLAFDFRNVDYENTDGFSEKGWTQTYSVKGFGWKNINILSAGFQFKGIKKLPLRIGYTYSSNPIDEELAFFSIPATAIIKNAYQAGFGYEVSENLTINGTYHYGGSDGKTEGTMLNPQAIAPSNPYGAIPGTNVGYQMTTDYVVVGISYKFTKK